MNGKLFTGERGGIKRRWDHEQTSVHIFVEGAIQLDNACFVKSDRAKLSSLIDTEIEMVGAIHGVDVVGNIIIVGQAKLLAQCENLEGGREGQIVLRDGERRQRRCGLHVFGSKPNYDVVLFLCTCGGNHWFGCDVEMDLAGDVCCDGRPRQG